VRSVGNFKLVVLVLDCGGVGVGVWGGGFILHPLAMCQDVRLLRYLLMRIASGFSSLLNEDSI